MIATLRFCMLLLVAAAGLHAEASEPQFDPVIQELEGWKVHVDPALLTDDPASEERRSLRMLENHLNFIALLVPEDRLVELRTCEIWIEREHPSLKNMQYHPGKQWLIDHGHDPRLTKKVHIPVARQLIARHQLLKHPMVVLHELAHAYHDQILGFDEARIKAAYEAAKKAGKYRNVLLYNGRRVLHYGMTNPKEYFAEGTEAYFNRNDFYPFVRAELKEHDPGFHEVLVEIWGDLR
ncbi:MAG: metallopeptidase [Verrucomicrobiota bacterium]